MNRESPSDESWLSRDFSICLLFPAQSQLLLELPAAATRHGVCYNVVEGTDMVHSFFRLSLLLAAIALWFGTCKPAQATWLDTAGPKGDVTETCSHAAFRHAQEC